MGNAVGAAVPTIEQLIALLTTEEADYALALRDDEQFYAYVLEATRGRY